MLYRILIILALCVGLVGNAVAETTIEKIRTLSKEAIAISTKAHELSKKLVIHGKWFWVSITSSGDIQVKKYEGNFLRFSLEDWKEVTQNVDILLKEKSEN